MAKQTKKTAAAAKSETVAPAPAKSNNTNAATVAREAFLSTAAVHAERVELLAKLDVSKLDAHDMKEHKEQTLAAKNRESRSRMFAKLLETESFANAFVSFGLTEAAVQKLQLYAQDKLMDTLRAIGANAPLSACTRGSHANMSTQAVVRALRERGPMQHSQILGAMHDYTGKALSTCSAQSSSSRQVLELLGMVRYDAHDRTYHLTDTADEHYKIMTA